MEIAGSGLAKAITRTVLKPYFQIVTTSLTRVSMLGLLGLAAITTITIGPVRADDWANLSQFKAANAAQMAKSRPIAVFLGDSITAAWMTGDPSLFSTAIVDRGIAGQTTSQILLRFQQDVVSLHPKIVHLMAGTNDVAENDGPISDADILNNVRAMLDIASVNNIKSVLASIPPMASVPWRPGVKGTAPRIVRLNRQLRALASERKAIFVDYHAMLKDAGDGLRADLANDGVHPNGRGYALMHSLAMDALREAER